MPDGSVPPGRSGASRTWGTTGREAWGRLERLLLLGDPLLLFLAGCGPIPFSSSLPFLFSSPKPNFAVSYSLPPPESLCTQQHLGILCSTARFPFQSHTVLLAVTCSRREVLFPRPGCRLAALGPVSGAGINLCM